MISVAVLFLHHVQDWHAHGLHHLVLKVRLHLPSHAKTHQQH
jgi:hypothetical protein